MFRQYLHPFSSECCMYWYIKLTVFLSFCVGVKLGVLGQEKNTDWGFVRAGWWGEYLMWREVGTEGYRRLHSFMSHPSLDIINIIHNVACKVRLRTHQQSRVESNPVQSDSQRCGRPSVPYLQRQPLMCVHTSRVKSRESCWVKSLDAACSIFVSQTLVIGRDGCYLGE